MTNETRTRIRQGRREDTDLRDTVAENFSEVLAPGVRDVLLQRDSLNMDSIRIRPQMRLARRMTNQPAARRMPRVQVQSPQRQQHIAEAWNYYFKTEPELRAKELRAEPKQS